MGHLQSAWNSGLRLARDVETMILDYHLLRSNRALCWLDRLTAEAGRGVIYTADFMGVPPGLLGAQRV